MGGFNTINVMPEALLSIPEFPVKRFKSAGHYWVQAQNHVPTISPTEGISHIVKVLSDPGVICNTEVKYLDAHIRSWVFPNRGGALALRYQGGAGDLYAAYLETGALASTADFKIVKWVAGAWTVLATEAVDLAEANWYDTVYSILGSTSKASRNGGATFPISATDTSITVEGYIGLRVYEKASFAPLSIGAPLSPPPRVIGYFEVPIIGSGTSEDPFRAQLPEDIRDGVNVLAVTHSALIKTGKDGKPIEYRAIVRIFDQPDRSPSLAPIERVLDALRAMKGVRELAREQAVKEAKRLDDKLGDLDLLSSRELRLDRRQAAKEYMSWRIHSLGIREELLDISIQERYVEEDKGW